MPRPLRVPGPQPRHGRRAAIAARAARTTVPVSHPTTHPRKPPMPSPARLRRPEATALRTSTPSRTGRSPVRPRRRHGTCPRPSTRCRRTGPGRRRAGALLGPDGELLDPPRRWRPRERVGNGADRTHQHLQALLLVGHRTPARQRPPRSPSAARRRRRTGVGAAGPRGRRRRDDHRLPRPPVHRRHGREHPVPRDPPTGPLLPVADRQRRASRRAGGQHGAAPHPAPRHQQPPRRVLHHRRQPPTARGLPTPSHRDPQHRHHAQSTRPRRS